MKTITGWTPDGQEVQLTHVQIRYVAWLLDPLHSDAAVPNVRLRGNGWSTAVATAAAYERQGYENNGPYGQEVAAELRAWLSETAFG